MYTRRFNNFTADLRFFAKWLRVAAVGLLALAGSGCLLAVNGFYLDSDIITDKRFEGLFLSKSKTETSLSIEAGRNKHYVATFREGGHWVKLDAVLFQVGTNLFVDISRLDDNGPPHKRSERVGTDPIGNP